MMLIEPSAWALELARDAIDHHGALQKPGELAELIDIMRRLAGHLERRLRIVEIGADAGGTLYVWEQLGAQTIAVSLPSGPFSSGRQLAAHGAQTILADSHLDTTRDAVWDALSHERADLVLIDGDHSYAGVRRDWDLYTPLALPPFAQGGWPVPYHAGVVALHDVCHHPHWPPGTVEVDRLWAQIKDNAARNWGPGTEPELVCLELIEEPASWGGLGLVTFRYQGEVHAF